MKKKSGRTRKGERERGGETERDTECLASTLAKIVNLSVPIFDLYYYKKTPDYQSILRRAIFMGGWAITGGGGRGGGREER